MTSFLLRRFLMLLACVAGAVVLISLAVEIALLNRENSGGQVIGLWRALIGGSLWNETWGAAALASLEAFGIAVLILLSFGPVLGVLAARFRRHAWVEVLLAPVFAAGWLPVFWIATLAVWAQFRFWNQPGYFDSASATGGPTEWETLWGRVVVAVPVAVSGIGWQVRHIAGVLKRAARLPHVRAAYEKGMTGGGLFYRHVFRNALPELLRSLDRVLPAMLGMQVLAEWACRFPGIGRTLIDAARASDFAGLLAAGTFFALLAAVPRWLGGSISRWAHRRDD